MPIKWSQRPDMTIAVDWGVEHQCTQTNKSIYSVWHLRQTSCADPEVGEGGGDRGSGPPPPLEFENFT